MTLSRADIKKPGVVEREIESLGGSVLIREMSGRDRVSLKPRFQEASESEDQEAYDLFAAEMVADYVEEEDGSKLFRDADDVLSCKDRQFQELFMAVLAVNGMGDSDPKG